MVMAVGHGLAPGSDICHSCSQLHRDEEKQHRQAVADASLDRCQCERRREPASARTEQGAEACRERTEHEQGGHDHSQIGGRVAIFGQDSGERAIGEGDVRAEAQVERDGFVDGHGLGRIQAGLGHQCLPGGQHQGEDGKQQVGAQGGQEQESGASDRQPGTIPARQRKQAH